VLTAEIKDLLLNYDWPGNIRELRNVIERAVILAGGEPLSVEDFALDTDDSPLVATDPGGKTVDKGLEVAEKQMIIDALEKSGGNKTEAASLLKITRRRLYSRMKVHGIKL
jgi:DNA-binding NtrC family response regulator